MPYNVTKELVQQEDSLQEAMLLQWYMSNVHHSILSTMTYVCPKYILSYLILSEDGFVLPEPQPLQG